MYTYIEILVFFGFRVIRVFDIEQLNLMLMLIKKYVQSVPYHIRLSPIFNTEINP